jgi:hypothetical protein
VVVLVRAELQRVHENAGHDVPAVQVRCADQARVAGVQVAHGRDESHGVAGLAPVAHEGAQIRDARDGAHGRGA